MALPLNDAGVDLSDLQSSLCQSNGAALFGRVPCEWSDGGWVDIDIVVNGVAVSPTAGDQDAFCSANHTAGFDFWNRISITVVIQGIQGNNTVRILGRRTARRPCGLATVRWLCTTDS